MVKILQISQPVLAEPIDSIVENKVFRNDNQPNLLVWGNDLPLRLPLAETRTRRYAELGVSRIDTNRILFGRNTDE